MDVDPDQQRPFSRLAFRAARGDAALRRVGNPLCGRMLNHLVAGSRPLADDFGCVVMSKQEVSRWMQTKLLGFAVGWKIQREAPFQNIFR